MPMLGSVFVNPYSSRSRGVATFVKAGAPLAACTARLAPEGGRLLDVAGSYAGVGLGLVNCYAPCVAAERPSFFAENLSACLTEEQQAGTAQRGAHKSPDGKHAAWWSARHVHEQWE